MTDGAPAVASNGGGAPDPLIGRVINERFRVTSVLARGGMGKVYLAEQAPLGRTCALKVLNPDYARGQDPEFHKRFFLEASIASKLAHPNTVTIFDFGKTDDGIYYMAMEYLEGRTLHRAIREAGHFSEERTAHVARQICRGLREAHSLGVVHRDLKPANIFLVEHADETDFVKILDFGLVKNMGEGDKDRFEDLTQAGLFMGSPKYMAPEQIRGERVDARTDVYALGVVMCEMITGKVPFDRPSSVKILMAQANEAPPALRTLNPNVAISSAFEEMVARCLAKAPNSRYRSMDEVLAALKRLALAGQGPSASDRSSHPRLVSESGPIPSLLRPPAAPESSPSASHGGLSGPMDAAMVQSSRSPRVPGVPDFGSSSPPAAAGPAKLRSRGVIVIAAFGVLGVAGVLGYGALRTGVDGPRGSAAMAAPAPPGPSALAAVPAATPPPAAPAIVKIRVNSEPAGATVKEDGVELCGSTPCDIVYKGSDADPSHEHTLVLSHPYFRPERTVVKGADATIVVRLTRWPEGPRLSPQPVPQPQATQRPEVPAAPSGYKTDLPY